MGDNNLLSIPPTFLDEVPGLADALADEPLNRVAASFPAASLPWALLAQQARTHGNYVNAYAYARTGYHRGLDALRRHGWKGQGPIPWSHEPNRGFLLSLFELGKAAELIGEAAEVDRVHTFLTDSDPSVIDAILADEAAHAPGTETIVIRGIN